MAAERFRLNRKLAKRPWGDVPLAAMETLKEFTRRFSFSIASGDLLLLGGRWYVTHVGLLQLAARRHCAGVRVLPEKEFCNPPLKRWAFKAVVYKTASCRGFVGYGDADPSNVSSAVQGAEMRIAEPRAVNRALRKAYGIGFCSFEEIGSLASKKGPSQPTNGNYGGAKVRDRLCQLIRQHPLDATLVKSNATDFCGVKTLREATREKVENFVKHLGDCAEKDRSALLCQLNSYMTHREREGVA